MFFWKRVVPRDGHRPTVDLLRWQQAVGRARREAMQKQIAAVDARKNGAEINEYITRAANDAKETEGVDERPADESSTSNGDQRDKGDRDGGERGYEPPLNKLESGVGVQDYRASNSRGTEASKIAWQHFVTRNELTKRPAQATGVDGQLHSISAARGSSRANSSALTATQANDVAVGSTIPVTTMDGLEVNEHESMTDKQESTIERPRTTPSSHITSWPRQPAETCPEKSNQASAVPRRSSASTGPSVTATESDSYASRLSSGCGSQESWTMEQNNMCSIQHVAAEPRHYDPSVLTLMTALCILMAVLLVQEGRTVGPDFGLCSTRSFSNYTIAGKARSCDEEYNNALVG